MDVKEVVLVIADRIKRELGDAVSSDQMVNSTFFELGLDSEKAVYITGELSDIYSLDIDPLLVFEYQTVNLLAEKIHAMLIDREGASRLSV